MNLTGKQIGQYRLLDQLGQGGMAIIYKAYDTRLEREVAIKLIRTQAIPAQQHERLMKRFEREAKAQAQFIHPNIVPVFDYGVHEGMPYLVMEYIPGGTLKDRITGPVGWQQAIEWILPIADALAYAHDQGVIHRDIKPSNILITPEGKPILTDFGIAKVLETDEGTLTGTGMGVGTPEYMAPEQWRGESTEASDQYALGVVLYELLTGQKPFTAETPVAIALKQMRDPLTRPSELAPGIPEAVEKVVYKALARQPKDRYKELRSLYQTLRSVVAPDDESQIRGKQLTRENSLNKIVNSRNGNRKINRRWGTWVIWCLLLFAVVLIGVFGSRGNWRLNLGSIESRLIGETNTPYPLREETAVSNIVSTKTATKAIMLTATPIASETPTPEFDYPLSFIGHDAIYKFDIAANKSEKIVDIIPSDIYIDGLQGEVIPASWDETGRYVVYQPLSSKTATLGKTMGKGLFVIDLLEEDQRVIFNHEARYIMGEWNPNGFEFYFLSDVEGDLTLYGFNVIDYELLKIFTLENAATTADVFLFFEWSPDGKYAAISANLTGSIGLYLLDIRNNSFEFIAYSNRFPYDRPFWDLESKNVIFPGNDFPSLRKFNIESRQISSVVNFLKQPSNLVRSPGSNLIYYQMDGSYSTESIYLLDLADQIPHSIEGFNTKYRHEFLTWKNFSTVLGSWSDAEFKETGLFEVDGDKNVITYQARTEINEYGTNDSILNSVFLKKSEGIYYFYQFSSGCVLGLEEDSWIIKKRVCFNVEEHDIIWPSFKFSKKNEMLIDNRKQLSYVDLTNLKVISLSLDQDFYNYFFGDNQSICQYSVISDLFCY